MGTVTGNCGSISRGGRSPGRIVRDKEKNTATDILVVGDGVAFPGIFHAWGKQIIGGIGWELVRVCVRLNGDSLPNFSILPDHHWQHQVAVNGPLYTLLAEEKCPEAG